jgi:hypothetical protein
MGSVRTGLTLLTMFTPHVALAQACDKIRPGWDGAPASAVTEALTLLFSPLGLLLLTISLIAARLRKKWLSLIAVVGWTGFVSLTTMLDPYGLRLAALAEGCIGSPTLFILIATGISTALILYTTSSKQNSKHGSTHGET